MSHPEWTLNSSTHFYFRETWLKSSFLLSLPHGSFLIGNQARDVPGAPRNLDIPCQDSRFDVLENTK